MRLPLTAAQLRAIEGLQTTYLGVDNELDEKDAIYRHHLNGKDLAIINMKEDLFPKTKTDRHFNKGVEHAKRQLTIINFLFENLPQYYKKEILKSDELQNILTKLLNINTIGSRKRSREEEAFAVNYASQMLVFGLDIVIRGMPTEFQQQLTDSLCPFVDLINAINKYSEKYGIANVKSLNLPDRFFKR